MLLTCCWACSVPDPPPATESRDEATTLPFRLVETGAVQTWRAGDEEAVLDTTTRRLTRGDQTYRARLQWPSWQSLELCLGDPLALPPAGDPAGFRLMAWDPEPTWVLDLSGANRCNATGQVSFRVDADSVNVEALLIDGLPWGEGGRERGRELALQAFRADVLTSWSAASETDRSNALLLLQHDPDPEAESILRALAELADHRLHDVERALANRPVQGPASAPR